MVQVFDYFEASISADLMLRVNINYGERNEAKSSNARKGDGINEEVRMRRETTRVVLQMACRFC